MALGGDGKKRAAKRTTRDAAPRPEYEGSYVPPDRADCVVKEWWTSIDDSATLRISFWLWRYEGRLVDFLIRIEQGDWSDPDDWQLIARIDCSGGNCHLHPPDRQDEHETIYRLDNIDDVQESFGRANELANKVAIMIRDRRS